jgi:hypothetical protein
MGDKAFLAVDLWQHDVTGESVRKGHRHTAVATEISTLPLPELPTSIVGLESRTARSNLYLLVSSAVFRGDGVTLSLGEDDDLALYVSLINGPGWGLQPAWVTADPSVNTSSGPGSGYMDASGNWTLQSTLGYAGCSATDSAQMSATGQFTGSGASLSFSWPNLTCPFGAAPVNAGSVANLRW